MAEDKSKANDQSVQLQPFEEVVAKCALYLISQSKEQGKALPALILPSPEKAREAEAARVLIALSGGVDSTALILALARSRSIHNLELEAAHFNHHLRGMESIEDESHCERLCQQLGIALHRGDARREQDKTIRGNSQSEDTLRRKRYSFLEETARSIKAQFILTGHNLDDQAETILFRLFRGTALAGMKGIMPFRQVNAGPWLIRPLLGINRAEIARYVLSRAITVCEDSSNANCRYTRNFIRHQIMPPLKDRFPAVLRQIENFARAASVDEDYLNGIARQFYKEHGLTSSKWSVEELKGLHQAIIDRVIALSLSNRNITVTTDLIKAVREQIYRQDPPSAPIQNARFSLDKAWDLVRSPHHIRWLNKSLEESPPSQFAVKIRIPGSTALLGLNKAIQVEEYALLTPLPATLALQAPANNFIELAVDLGKLCSPLILRRREPGDCIQPSGSTKPTSLKKYLHRRKASQLEDFCRARIDRHWTATSCLVLVSEEEVLWVPGIGASEKLTVKPGCMPSHIIRLIDLSLPDTSIC